MRDPTLRPLIIRGYKRLALVLAAGIAMFIPTLLYGILAARVSLLLVGAFGIVFCVYEFYIRRWSARLSATVALISCGVFSVAWALGQTGPNAEGVKTILSLSTLVLLWYGLPKIVAYEAKVRARKGR